MGGKIKWWKKPVLAILTGKDLEEYIYFKRPEKYRFMWEKKKKLVATFRKKKKRKFFLWYILRKPTLFKVLLTFLEIALVVFLIYHITFVRYRGNTPEYIFTNLSQQQIDLLYQYIINPVDDELMYTISKVEFINMSGYIPSMWLGDGIIGLYSPGWDGNHITVKTNTDGKILRLKSDSKNIIPIDDFDTRFWILRMRSTFCHEILHNWVMVKGFPYRNRADLEHYIIEDLIDTTQFCYT